MFQKIVEKTLTITDHTLGTRKYQQQVLFESLAINLCFILNILTKSDKLPHFLYYPDFSCMKQKNSTSKTGESFCLKIAKAMSHLKVEIWL